MVKNRKVVYFIMAGGEGMRLWPLSRASFPKQLHSLLGDSSLLQQTIKRVLKPGKGGNILIGTKEDLYFSIRDQWRNLKLKSDPWLILEPLSRNTAPAIALAVMACRERFGKDVILVVLAADHVISREKRFRALVNSGIKSASAGNIVTFGVVPAYPETGYGYIKAKGKLSKDIYKIEQFKEKPSLALARRYVKNKNYFWNSGMFMFDTGVAAENLKKFAPKVWNAAERVWQKRSEKNNAVRFKKDLFAELPAISIDYAVMEKAPKRTVIRADFGWCDVGCWNMVHEVSPKDKNGNVLSGNVCTLDTETSFIKAGKRFVAAVGLKNLVVIDTRDALLLTDKNRSQDVKMIVNKLNAEKSSLTKFHATVYRPWGNYTVLEEGPGYKIKRVVVNPGQRLSLQKHHKRSEHWVVVSGRARIICDSKDIVLQSNQSVFIPKNHVHRISNPYKKEVVIIEVQTGAYLGEDDIVRYDDIYERNISI